MHVVIFVPLWLGVIIWLISVFAQAKARAKDEPPPVIRPNKDGWVATILGVILLFILIWFFASKENVAMITLHANSHKAQAAELNVNTPATKIPV